MIPLAVPNLIGNEKKYLEECIDTTFVSSVGEFVERFEKMGAMLSGAKYATAVSSGTEAIHIALLATGVMPGDLVIIPSYTFIATANAVVHCGALPWCIDSEEKTWTIDAHILETELKKKTTIRHGSVIHRETGKRVKAVMPVFTLGAPADMDSINRVADEYGLPVIIDAAAALGAEYKGRESAKCAKAVTFSFNGNKTFTCGGGGLIAGNDKDLISYAKHISTTARSGIGYDFDAVGYNYRMTNLQAAVGCGQLERFDELLEKKRYIRRRYNEEFKNLKNAVPFCESEWGKSADWFSGLVLTNDDVNVEEVCSNLKKNGIEGRTFWKPVHLQKPYKDCIRSEMRVCEAFWDKVVVLPCSTTITKEEIDTVISVVLEIIG